MKEIIHQFKSLNNGHFEDLEELKQTALAGRVPIIKDEALTVLIMLIKEKQAENILEIGAAVGYSALQMAGAAGKAAKVISLESDPEMVRTAKENFKQYDKFNQIEIFEGKAEDLTETAEMYGPYDLLFIDAAKARYKDFFESYATLLSPGGIIICDNVAFRGYIDQKQEDIPKRYRKLAEKMRAFNEWLSKKTEYQTYFLEAGDGISISIHKG